MLNVSSVTYQHGFTLRIGFDNGVTKDVDLAEELQARFSSR